MNKEWRITLLGAMPPTIGGVSIHVERLADSLAKEGWAVKVFDLFTKHGVLSDKPYSVVRGRSLSTWVSLFADGFFRRPDLVHIHISSGRHLPLMTPYLIWLRLTGRLIITIHSGSAPTDIGGFSGIKDRLVRWGLGGAHRLVCVNSEIADYLKGRFPELATKLRCVIPFIVHPKAVRHPVSPDRPPVLLASGYGTPLYEWLTLIDACDGAVGVGEVHLVFYNTYDPDYFPQVEAACARRPGKYRIHKDLTPDAFAELLGGVDCFVRPTLTDGDSIAVREALALGIPVIASDCVARPSGCLLFPTRDAGALRNVIEAAIRAGLPPPVTSVSCAVSTLMEIYQEVISAD